ncbi:hypothetical protein B0H14DRAFT_3853603 [Mycena olivaceomarginata]|nr:hypothetical protein B0H14DRAFT_3853603 [Mycena olivaceomarginata]
MSVVAAGEASAGQEYNLEFVDIEDINHIFGSIQMKLLDESTGVPTGTTFAAHPTPPARGSYRAQHRVPSRHTTASPRGHGAAPPLWARAYRYRDCTPVCAPSVLLSGSSDAESEPVFTPAATLSLSSTLLRFIPRSRHACSGLWDGCESVTTKSMPALVAALILRRHEGGRTSSAGALIARRDIRGFLSSASPLATDASLDYVFLLGAS